MRIQTNPKQGSIVSKIGRRIQKTYPKFARIQKTYPKLHQRIQKKCASKILDTNRVFKTRAMLPIRIKNNLMDIRYKYNIREAGVWWRLIFGSRIPVDPEYEFVMVPNPNSI